MYADCAPYNDTMISAVEIMSGYLIIDSSNDYSKIR